MADSTRGLLKGNKVCDNEVANHPLLGMVGCDGIIDNIPLVGEASRLSQMISGIATGNGRDVKEGALNLGINAASTALAFFTFGAGKAAGPAMRAGARGAGILGKAGVKAGTKATAAHVGVSAAGIGLNKAFIEDPPPTGPQERKERTVNPEVAPDAPSPDAQNKSNLGKRDEQYILQYTTVAIVLILIAYQL